MLPALVFTGLPGQTGVAVAASSKAPQGFKHVHALVVRAQGETLLVGIHQGLFRCDDAGVPWGASKVQK